jgi:D-3-phosphoglycerate dehydrogenase
MGTVLLTDHTWPDSRIEREMITAAGHRFVEGPAKAGTSEAIEALVAAHDPDAIMVTYAPITRQAIATPSRLRLIARIGIGTDNVAIDAATERGVWVTNVPDYCIEEVSDHALALMLALTRGITRFDREVKGGRWGLATGALRRSSSLVIGIVGYGRIGRATARKAHGLGATVLAYDVMKIADGGPATSVELPELLARSDVVILHAPLDASTRHMVDRRFVAAMRQGAILINVSRGPLVDNEAILEGLTSGKLAGVGLDVVEGEPNPPRALVEHEAVVVTPHVAYASDLATLELRRRASEEVVRVLAGQRPRNPVNDVAVRAS